MKTRFRQTLFVNIAMMLLLLLGRIIQKKNCWKANVLNFFMDIQMPNMDGYKATLKIRTLPNKEKANIPIVAMTANAFAEDREKALKVGMNGHIVKPIDAAVIEKTLASIWK